MKINLICPAEYKQIIKDLLRSYNIDFHPDAKIHLCARGGVLPQRGVSIVFDVEKSDELTAFFDSFETQKKNSGYSSFLPGRTAHGFNLIPVKDILFFEAQGNYVYAHMKDKSIEVDKKLYELEEVYQTQGFVRISKSYIVNILNVKEIIPWFSGKLILKLNNQEKELSVSRNYVKDFKRFIGIRK